MGSESSFLLFFFLFLRLLFFKHGEGVRTRVGADGEGREGNAENLGEKGELILVGPEKA